MLYRLTIDPGSDTPQLDVWRDRARALLLAAIPPDAIELSDATTPQPLALGFSTEPDLTPRADAPRPSVPTAFLDLAELAACHASPGRWQLLYRVLWRLQSNRELLRDELDDDVAELRRLHAQVNRDLHKMHAYVRFRVVEEALATSPDTTAAASRATIGDALPDLFAAAPPSHAVAADPEGYEHYVAWYRPDHRILALAVPFFAERFAVMRWTIFTDYASASWDPRSRRAIFGPGAPRPVGKDGEPAADELASMWRSYYGAIFNPARLNTRAMKAEMPVRYWKNLPELDILPHLLQQADRRVGTMMAEQDTDTAAPFVPSQHLLPVLAEALPRCQGCDLYKHATQAVFGEGPGRASLMLIGEQPGDEEDRRGAPFIGPAGKVFDKALAELGLNRGELYVTNAVKHFKFVERGRRRIHESPKLRELSACRPWLLAELDAVQPKVVVCLGASAAKSLLGAKFALMKDRGKVVQSPYADKVIATLHPSAI
ncbi:MAG TPA: UdgX family uracil-DNA binding protein, partial [Acidobacteriaceae bacterium]